MRQEQSQSDVGLSLLRFTLCAVVALSTVTLLAYQPALQPIAPPPSPTATFPSPLPFLGINTALEQYNPTERRAALARLRATGFGWVRQRLDWATLEPTPGNYAWATSDAIVQDILAVDLVPVIVLDGSPAWARAPQDRPPTDNPFAPPAAFQDFARVAAAVAGRYRDQLTFYQIWDEPNIAPHWGNRLIEPVAYAQLLRVTATAIRNADPDATIVSAALAPTRDRGHTAIDEVAYLQRLYAAGAAPYFDVLAIQPFGFGTAPTDPRIGVDHLNFGRAHLIRQTMVASGDGATPIWAVRYGWNRQLASPWATVPERDQIHFAVEALTLARREWPWLTAMAWVIDQPKAPPTDPSWGFALSAPLADAFRAWVAQDASAKAPSTAVADAVSGNGRNGALYGLLLLLALWRMVAMGRRLPWGTWGERYRALPWWVRATLWLALVALYYVAVWPPLLLLCWLVAALLLWWQPWVGVGLAAALIPFYTQHKEFALGSIVFALAPTPVLLLCLLPAGVAAAFKRSRGHPLRHLRAALASELSLQSFPSVTHLALLWLFANLLSAVNVWHWPAYWEGLWDLVLIPLLGFGLIRLFLSAQTFAIPNLPCRVLTMVATALFVGGVAVGAIGLLGWLRGDGTTADGLLRLVGPYYSPNQAAFYLVRSLFLGLGLRHLLPRRRLVMGAALALISTALLLTASRGALLLGLPAGLLLWYGGGYRRQRRLRFIWPTVALGRVPFFGNDKGGPNRPPGVIPKMWYAPVALGAVALLLGWLLLGERLTNSATLLHRLTIWQSSWSLWLDYIWFGVGPGGFFWRYPAYLPLSVLDEPNLYHPHNLWLEFATGWGLAGLLWLLLLLWYLVRQLRRLTVRHDHSMRKLTDWLTLSLLAALAAGLAHAQVDAFLVLPDLALWLWFALGLLGSLPHNSDRQPTHSIRPAQNP